MSCLKSIRRIRWLAKGVCYGFFPVLFHMQHLYNFVDDTPALQQAQDFESRLYIGLHESLCLLSDLQLSAALFESRSLIAIHLIHNRAFSFMKILVNDKKINKHLFNG